MADYLLAWFGALERDDIALLLAALALIYAHLAYWASVKDTKQARGAELTSLRLQAQSGLTDARRNYLAIEATCRANRDEWARYERQLPPLRSRVMVDFWPHANVGHEARVLLADLEQSFDAFETMNQAQLEGLLKEVQSTSLQFVALTGALDAPPAYH